MTAYVRENLLEKFEFYSYGHALEILGEAFPGEWDELQDALERFAISLDDLRAAGGNETAIPKKFDDVLYPLGWREIRITGDLVVNMYPRRASQRGRFAQDPCERMVIEGYIDGHNIDFIKGRVAFDLEWNSKDQTFDRDLYAFRTFYECGVITCGVIITRSEGMNQIFSCLGSDIKKKYGASTTWMGKLLPRIHARRHGGCPLLVVGLTPDTVSDWAGGIS